MNERENDVEKRIRGEYREMPGLSLNDAQARKLFGVDPGTLNSVFGRLLETGFLRRTPKGYIRAES